MAPSSSDIVSATIGWTYMLLWTASFYPQFLLNLRRKSTHGFSIEFALLNVLGMGSYAVYNLALYFSPVVRGQYARRHPTNPEPAVQPNDVAYAVHGSVITILTYSQFYPRLWRFSRENARAGGWALGLFWACIGLTVLAILAVAVDLPSMAWEWIDVVRIEIRTGLLLISNLRKDLPARQLQSPPHVHQVCATGAAELQAQVNTWS
jgi:cystinosin